MSLRSSALSGAEARRARKPAARRRSRLESLIESGTRVEQARLHGSFRDTELKGELSHRHSVQVVGNQDRALVDVQSVERFIEVRIERSCESVGSSVNSTSRTPRRRRSDILQALMAIL